MSNRQTRMIRISQEHASALALAAMVHRVSRVRYTEMLAPQLWHLPFSNAVPGPRKRGVMIRVHASYAEGLQALAKHHNISVRELTESLELPLAVHI